MTQTQDTRLKAIHNMYAAHAQAEIRIAKQLQAFYTNKSWTDCIKEAKIYVDRHGPNIELLPPDDSK